MAAATVEMDQSIFPSGLFGPDVTAELAECAGLVEAGRLGAAKGCYEGVRAGASGDADAVEGVRAGLERIARMEAAVRGVQDAIGRGEFGEAREGLERLRELNANHPRLVELEGEIVRAEREWEERKRADDAAFERAKGAGTVTALDGYLSSCAPLCGHAEEARRLKVKAEEREPGRRFRDCAECSELVVVPSGTYRMGSPSGESQRDANEGPVHRVRIGRPFAVGVKEVTVGEYGRFVSETGRSMGNSCYTYEGSEWKERSGRSWRNPGFSQTDEHPVVCVNWDDAKAYVGWLSEKTGQAYRLLSESEWEYVARAGTTGPFHTGSTISTERANYHGNFTYGSGRKGQFRKKTIPVGSFPANGFGLHDVHGNVWEWVEDCYSDGYVEAPSDGSAWEWNCDRRVLRGGSWGNGPRVLRSANRSRSSSGDRFDYFGFRIVRTLTP